jgi:hypothetical protein
VQIKNPNYLLYQYSSVIKEVQIKDDLPDISDLIQALNGIPIAPNSSFELANSARGTECLDDLSGYFTIIDTLQRQIQRARNAIVNSDDDTMPFKLLSE